MRNLKKILSLALALVMTLSVMSFASAASNNFGDSDEVNATYAEAVDVLNGLKVFVGDTNDNFNPKDNISRAEVAAVIYRIATQDVTNAQIDMYATSNYFSDVTADKWFAGYVNYCANATYVKGTGEDLFDPYGEVTGYQVLAMILRVAGYDANGEFTGADWQIKVASTAKELGILETVADDVRLDQSVTREVVAELLFQTLEKVNKVRYTNAFGYVTEFGNGYNYDNLGDYLFGLEKSQIVTVDDWGRPGYNWTASKPASVKGVIASYTLDAIYTTTVKVDECDVAKAVGATAPVGINSAYIDGVVTEPKTVTTDANGAIDPLATTSYVGAQGRVTEVYDLSQANLTDNDGKAITGYRIVEINTYLAQVEKVTDAYTDKNDHPVAASIDLKVYTSATPVKKNVETTGFTNGSYVLVHYNLRTDAIEASTIEEAKIVSGGYVTTWTNGTGADPDTTTVVSTKYNDSDKFFLNWRDTTAKHNVALDSYGNIIGLIDIATNYLVINAIEWKQGTTVNSGYALANVVLADGTVLNNVTVSTINGIAASNAGDSYGDREKAIVSDHAANNGRDEYVNGTYTADQNAAGTYYGHIFAYSVDANGAYELIDHGDVKEGSGVDYDSDAGAESATHGIPNLPATTKFVDATAADAEVLKGSATINTAANTNLVVGTDNTVYLVQTAENTAFTVYVGKNNVPSGSGKMCAMTVNGYATLVVLTDYTMGNKFTAYVMDDDADTTSVAFGKGYYVYKVGETTPTVIYDDASDTFTTAFAASGTGLYTFEVDNNGVVANTTATFALGDINASKAVNDGSVKDDALTYDLVAVTEATSGNSFQTQTFDADSIKAAKAAPGYTFTTANAAASKDFNVTSATKVILVNKAKLKGDALTLKAGTAADITTDSIVIVGYTATVGGNNTIYDASVVYVFSNTVTAASDTMANIVESVVNAKASDGSGNILATNVTGYADLDEALKHKTTLLVNVAEGLDITVNKEVFKVRYADFAKNVTPTVSGVDTLGVAVTPSSKLVSVKTSGKADELNLATGDTLVLKLAYGNKSDNLVYYVAFDINVKD